jgi:hypothetical protein
LDALTTGLVLILVVCLVIAVLAGREMMRRRRMPKFREEIKALLPASQSGVGHEPI